MDVYTYIQMDDNIYMNHKDDIYTNHKDSKRMIKNIMNNYITIHSTIQMENEKKTFEKHKLLYIYILYIYSYILYKYIRTPFKITK